MCKFVTRKLAAKLEKDELCKLVVYAPGHSESENRLFAERFNTRSAIDCSNYYGAYVTGHFKTGHRWAVQNRPVFSCGQCNLLLSIRQLFA